MAGNCNNHLPSLFAIVLKFFPLNLIFIFSPFEAQPQILIFESLCKTMLSRISRGSLTWAGAVCAMRKKQQNAAMIFKYFVSFVLLLCVLCLPKYRSQSSLRTTTGTKHF